MKKYSNGFFVLLAIFGVGEGWWILREAEIGLVRYLILHIFY